ncbi:IS66-like element accessory protein TnpA [Tranquillimonas alkanivorans]|uniref:Transposase n=1 Tax=Tranquillimonas alkanivorans TaxID=441119 RepID=A0A1I5UXI3_9RHOB|nr:transposase [Tranquillimonas alkanivorans]SFQ00034.1 transposase [Tranquillimonas alkanivorans]
MRGEVLGIERRRRWPDEEKLAVVSSVGVDGATVTQVAQRYDISRQQVYAWRHELKKKGLWSPDQGAIFLPVSFPVPGNAPAEPEPDPGPPVQVELRLGEGRCLRFDSGMDGEALTRLIRAVEAA